MRNCTLWRKRYQITLLSLAILALGGCKKSYSLEPVATKANELLLKDGTEFLISRKKHSRVIAANAFHNDKREFAVFLKVTSLGSSRKNFIPREHVKAYFLPAATPQNQHLPRKELSVPLRVYNGDGYLRVVAKRQSSEATWSAVAQGLAAASAGQGQATSHTTASASYTDSDGYYGNAYGSATTTTTYTDPVAQELALQRAERNMAQLSAHHTQTYDRLANSVLRRTSLNRKESVSGRVYVDDGGKIMWPDRDDRLILRVYVGKERHTFHFRRARY